MQTPTTVTAVASGGDAIATLPASIKPRRLVRLSITGARNSRAEVYLGAVTASARVDQTSRGESNTTDTPLDIPSGMTVSVRWPGKAAAANSSMATFITE
jgi:hypothetical protein